MHIFSKKYYNARWTAMHISAYYNHSSCLEKLLKMNANIDAQDQFQKTPLMMAAEQNKVECVEILVSTGANVSATDREGWTALHRAARTNSLEALKVLLQACINPEIPDKKGCATPIYIASQNNHLDILRVLIQAGADVNTARKDGWTPLIIACDRGHTEAVQALLNAGANAEILDNRVGTDIINTLGGGPAVIETLTTIEGNCGGVTSYPCKTLTIIVDNWGGVQFWDSKTLTHMVAKCVMNKRDGYNLKFLSCENRKLTICVCRCHRNANVTLTSTHYQGIRDFCDKSYMNNLLRPKKIGGERFEILGQFSFRPLHSACQFGHLNAAGVLLNKRVDLYPHTNLGLSPLHLAAANGREQLGRLLVEKGHPLKIYNKKRETPADMAQQFGQVNFHYWIKKKMEYASSDLSHNPFLVECRQQYEWEMMDLANLIKKNPQNALLNIRNGNYDANQQDIQRKTALHYAAAAGNLDTVEELVDFGCYPFPVSLDGQTPADLALKNGFKQVHSFLIHKAEKNTQLEVNERFLKYLNFLKAITHSERRAQASDLEAQNEMFEVVKNMSLMLCQGTPLIPPSKKYTELLFMALGSHSLRILELLLCAGAPWYGTVGTYDILQMVWLSQTSTTKEIMMVTRQIEMQLRHELIGINLEENYDSTLRDRSHIIILQKLGANQLPLEEQQDIKPWRASWPREVTDSLSRSYKSQAHLLVRACRYGATGAAWFMWRSGVNTSLADDQGNLPLLTALSNGHMDTVQHLVSYMGCNPFIKTIQGDEPFQLIPQPLRQAILQRFALSEFNRLENSLSSAKDEDKKLKIKRFTLLFVCLYCTFSETEGNVSWKELYSYTLELLSESLQVKEHIQYKEFDKKDDRFTWSHHLCQKIGIELDVNLICNHLEDEPVSLQEFLRCLNQLRKNIVPLSKEKFKLHQKKRDRRLTITCSKKILLEALEFLCEKKYYLFLHMLIAHIGLDPNITLNDMLQTCALHHAAAEGNTGIVAYLIQSCDINRDVVDRNGNNAAHYAYLNGHMSTGNYLIEYRPQLEQMINSSMKTPLQLKYAFNDRAKNLDNQQLEENTRNMLNEKLQVACEQSNETELTKFLINLDNFQKDIRKSTFKEIALKKLVDYNVDEGRLIYEEIVSFIKRSR
ncbi:unnamed protein product [Meganyctiphanes norvegica]|uniref:Uncharacterized protein n=1 Tax=Meganyctiphanes norvegica TaxID=48144 RepID=A0AAV2QVT5_MEGNR